MTVPTKDHPAVLHDFGEVCPQMPVTLRRAAINAASGAVASHLTNQGLWEKADPQGRGRDPSLPEPHPHLTLYGGMYELGESELRKGLGRLKVLSGGRWRWIDVPLTLPPYALDLFAQSEAEQVCIRAERAEQNARMAAERRDRRTTEERASLRGTPGVWVAQAVALGLQVLVFEYLRPYRPERGLSWSRRTNRKRSYWLRGQVLRHVRDLALCEGILVVERNPAWTSQACPACHHLAERFTPGGAGNPSRLHCGHCGWSGDANVAAALNLKLKWDRTFHYPTAEDRRAADTRRAREVGATVNPEQVPIAV